MAAMGAHVRAMLDLQARGAITFDYGNNIRAQAEKAGVADAFRIPGFVPEYIRPLFCRGKGPFRWAALSGDPADIDATDRLALEMFADDEPLCRWIRLAVGARRVPGPAGAHLLARLRRARALRPRDQRPGPPRRGQGADRHRPRSSRHRFGGVAEPGDRGHARRQRRDRRLADPECAAEHVVGRDLGVGPPRRRRRHRLLAARGHGDRRRRHPRSGRETAARPDLRSWQRRRAARGRGLPGRHRHSARARNRHAHAAGELADDDSRASHARAPRARGPRRIRRIGTAHPGRARRLRQRPHVAAAAAARSDRAHPGAVHGRRADRDHAGAVLHGAARVVAVPGARLRTGPRLGAGRPRRVRRDAGVARHGARPGRRRRRRSCSTSSSSSAPSRASPACAACCAI